MYKLNDFTTDTHKIAHIPEHVRAFSGRSTIGRTSGSVTGVERFFCPPLTAETLSFTLDFNVVSHGIQITDRAATGHNIKTQLKLQSEKWHPSYFWRKGAAHQYLGENKSVSLLVETWTVPSAIDDSFYVKLKIQNISDQFTKVELIPNWKSICFEKTSQLWEWDAPNPPQDTAERIAPGVYQGKNSFLSLFWSSCAANADTASLELESHETKEIILKALFSDSLSDTTFNPDDELNKTLSLREEKWNEFLERVPHLHTNHNGLEKAYMHSLLTMFLCTWNSPHFITDPFYSEAGINGNCLCSYTWGDAYVSKITSMAEKENYRKHILAQIRMGLSSHYAFDPITGKGVGPCYNYNLFSIVTCIKDYIEYTGDFDFLSFQIDGTPLYRHLVNIAKELEGRLNTYGSLLDYGTHNNLLEMRGSGYEHFVPSPNGERVVIYRYLADILDMFGYTDESKFYRNKAEAVKKDFAEKLWDTNADWPKCIYPDMHEELVYSIQMFDLLNKDILTHEQEDAILSRLNEDEFLSEYGVNSISKTDFLHFDLGDVDWSGAGAYLGDPCALIEVLFNMNKPEQAWDVAKRILWWSDCYPYWPQSIWVGKQAYSHWEQPICRSGFAFAQAIVFGMFGLHIKNGQAAFNLQLPEEIGDAWLTNVKIFDDILSTK